MTSRFTVPKQIGYSFPISMRDVVDSGFALVSSGHAIKIFMEHVMPNCYHKLEG